MSVKVALTNQTKYELLLQISQKVRNTLDLDEILNLLLDTLLSTIEYDAAGIFILNTAGILPHQLPTKIRIAGIARRGFDPHPEESDPMLMLGKGITGFVIDSGREAIIPDVSKDDRYVIGRKTTRSEVALPIIMDGRAIGAFNVESDRINAFGRKDLDVLRFFADAAAISIEKAMLHRNLLEKQLMDQQMKTASAIQAQLIPDHAPRIPGYDISGTYIPADEIGGDYFDFIPLKDGRFGIVLADVSGHGVPAALVMSAFRALLRTQAQIDPDPASIFHHINSLLPEISGIADFVTGIYGILDPKNGSFIHTNCGHHPFLCLRADGHMENSEIGNPALGIFKNLALKNITITLNKGDSLIIYTDGIIESQDQKGETFGTARLSETISRFKDLSAEEMISKVIQAVDAFFDNDTFLDDVTLLILKKIS
jgi:sigma-B regulation protein RsbU (phosphoserine phosphatase)